MSAVYHPDKAAASAPCVDYDALQRVGRDLLVALGEDPEREGLRDTPRRFASMWREFIEYQPGTVDTTFEAITTDQLVVVKGLRVWSMCEHHLLPFWCDLRIAYVARERVLGLSKFGRIAQAAAHRLQLQERVVHQIADTVQEITRSPDVAVLAEGEHLCMVARGIAMPHRMVSSAMRGLFLTKPDLKAEFLAL